MMKPLRIVQISVGEDGAVYALDAGGNVWVAFEAFTPKLTWTWKQIPDTRTIEPDA